MHTVTDHVERTVVSAARSARMSEADFFRAVYSHEGINDESWRFAYDRWCERSEVPRSGYRQWFLDICVDVLSGRLTLSRVTSCAQSQPLFAGNNDCEDDGN